jgi:hypothetical protein
MGHKERGLHHPAAESFQATAMEHLFDIWRFPRLRGKLYLLLQRNALRAPDQFEIPPNRVIELGTPDPARAGRYAATADKACRADADTTAVCR